MKAINIKWDIYGEENNMTLEELNNVLEALPKELDIPESLKDEDEISNWISNKVGYCHLGFDLIKGNILYRISCLSYDDTKSAAFYEILDTRETYDEALEYFNGLKERNEQSFFEDEEINHLCFIIEECDKTEDSIVRVNIKNKWDICRVKSIKKNDNFSNEEDF